MNSKVIKLADLDQFEINPEYKKMTVTDEEIQALIESMASNLGKTVAVDAIEENCGVVCKTEDGAKILIYPSIQIAGAEQAACDVKDKAAGDTFTTVIKEKEMTLTVEQILVNRPLAVDDDLAKESGIEGVSTLEQLRENLKLREIEKQKEENVRLLVSDYVQYLLANSELELDQEEVTEWTVPEAKRVYEEELSFGIDLRFTEEGEMLTEEEALARLAEDLRSQFAENLIQEKFGQERGFVPSDEDMMGNPYDVYMYQTLSERAKEALA